MTTPRRPRVIFMAFGTQGDVHPLAAVAAGLAKVKPDCWVFFITHVAHESLATVLSESGVSFVFIASFPVLSASCLHSICTIESVSASPQSIGGTDGSGWKSKIDEQHRQECQMAVGKILNCEQHDGDYIVINFFALEGWHLAEVYQIPCAVAAPYVMPYSAPVSFERNFMRSHPLLYEKLKRQGPGMVGWEDVVHWMWPIFTDRWTEWRTNHLHLSSCPFTDPVTEIPVGHNWPAEPLVMYGFSREVVECPLYWPNNVHVCGFWFLEASVSDFELQQSSYPELLTFLKKSTSAPIFFGFSSIGSMGLLHNPEGMLDVLGSVIQTTGQNGILFTAAYAPLEAAIIAASKKESQMPDKGLISTDEKTPKEVSSDGKVLQKGICLFGNKLFCFSGTVPYLWLFPKCSLVVHHGGSGTTAAALFSGIPQVICPFLLDQFYWAERMAWIGVAPEPLKREHLIPSANSETHLAVGKLLHAIREAVGPRIKARAANLGQKLKEEDGVQVAVEALCKAMQL